MVSKYGWIYELGLISYANNNNADALKYIQLAGEKVIQRQWISANLAIANWTPVNLIMEFRF
jgi:hypothetical protein